MSDIDLLDELLPLAYAAAHDLEPTDRQVAAVVSAAGAPRRGRVTIRRAAGIGAASLTVATATAFAVPQSREAILDAAGAFRDFFTGGSVAPGSPVAPSEDRGQLNWFSGSDAVTGNVIAQDGDLRIVAYRQRGSGLPCIEWGQSVSECRTPAEWTDILRRRTVYLGGPIAVAPGDRVPIAGIAGDRVASVRIQYADGSSSESVAVEHGFIAYADPARKPQRLLAADSSGQVVGTVDLTGYQWSFPTP